MATPSDRGPEDHDLDDETDVDIEELDGRPIALLVRQTLDLVADHTVVSRSAGRALPLEPTSLEVPTDVALLVADPEATGSRRARRWPLLAAAAVLVAVIAGVVVRSTDSATTTQTGPATTGAAPPPTAAPELPLGPDAWMAPPRAVDDLEVRSIEVEAATMYSGPEPLGMQVRGPIGPLVLGYNPIDPYQRTVTYRFDRTTTTAAGSAPSGVALRVTAVTGIRVDPSMLPLDTPAASSATSDGIRWVDLASRCEYGADGLAPGSWQLTPGSGCRRVLLAWSDDQVVVIDADPLVIPDPLAAAVAGLEVLTLDEVEARFAGIDGADSLRTVDETARTAPVGPSSSVPPSPSTSISPSPPPSEVSIPDTPLCQSWANVLRHAAEPVELSANAAMFEDMLAMEAAAPPELAADIHLLAELWAQTPPPPESAAVMQRVMDGAYATCGFMSLMPG
jgi:hypothetical protein